MRNVKYDNLRRSGSTGRIAVRRGRAGCPRYGFTLIELLTVVGIIIIILAVVGPAMSSIMKGNKQKEATNTITIYLASARAMALNYKTPVGVVFYEDPTNPYQTAVQFVELTSWSGMKFSALGAAAPEYLPANIKVATLNDQGTVLSTEALTDASIAARCRMILFDGYGQLVLVKGINVDTLPPNPWPGNPVPGNTLWLGADTSGAGGTATTSPGLCVYDSTALKNASGVSGFTAIGWLQTNADVLVVNALTGNVIR